MLPDKEPLQSANDGGQALLLFEVASDESSTCWYLHASKVRDKVRQFPQTMHLQRYVSCCGATLLISLVYFCSQ